MIATRIEYIENDPSHKRTAAERRAIRAFTRALGEREFPALPGDVVSVYMNRMYRHNGAYHLWYASYNWSAMDRNYSPVGELLSSGALSLTLREIREILK